MYQERIEYYRTLEEDRGSKVLAYITGDRRRLETKISSDAVQPIVHHLDRFGKIQRLSVVLYTPGGHTHSARSIVNLLRQFCTELEIIVPAKAHSAGTLMCLAANQIVMTKQATLGPIDPSVQLPINPAIPGAPPQVRCPVSVEDLNGFLEFARQTLDDPTHIREAFQTLCKEVHPLVLGNAYRARNQIRMVAKGLIAHQAPAPKKVEGILRFLCSESGSHDYTIDRDEADDRLGLPIEQPDDSLYQTISALFNDMASELKLNQPYDPAQAPAGHYCFTRALVESADGGSHKFESEGELGRTLSQPGQLVIEDNRSFEGWRFSNDD